MEGINFFDGSIMAFIQAYFHNAFTDAVFPVITYFGEAGLFWLALSLILLFFKKTRKCGLCALIAVACGFLLGEVMLKNVFCRPRPYQTFPDYVVLLTRAPGGYSFPSGHTCSSFAAATVYFHFSKKWGTPALILAGLIGFSRIFLFFHWPTDVLAGMVLGIGMALLTVWAVPKIAEKRRKDLDELAK